MSAACSTSATTVPDILWDIGLLPGRLSAPHDIDMKRLVRVARNLRGQPNLGAWLPRNKDDQSNLIVTLRLWSDANRAASPDSLRKSVSCGVVEANGCVLHS